MSNIVAIIGRPNVGKSTLFNRLTSSRKAIVDELSGVTRDRNYGKVEWNGITFSLIDTGGYVTNSDDIFEEEIRKQVLLAIDEADVLIFLVDVQTGITDLEENLAKILRKCKKKVFLVVNKVDTNDRQYDANVFYGLGLGDFFNVSSMNGSGTGDLLDAVLGSFQKEDSTEELDLPKITIVGRPKVGKSSLFNALLGEERNIVTPVSGTTRDSIYIRYNKFGQDVYLVDTAGLRKKGRTKEDVEFYSIMRAIRAIENSDICLLMIDATTGIESQDLNIFQLIQKNKKGIVILVNKWDLVEKNNNSTKEFTEALKKRIAPFSDVPIIFISATTNLRIHRVLETAVEVNKNRKKHIPTSELNRVMLEASEGYNPPAVKGKYVKIKYVAQLNTYSPTIVFYCNLPQYVKEPYLRYLENKLRANFDFSGVPINVLMRQK